MRVRLKEGEEILRKGLANHHANGKKEGGRLYLTNRRIYFVPYKVDTKNRPVEVLFTEIEDVDFMKAHGIIGHGLVIICKEGLIREFFVYGRKRWADEIISLLAELNESE